MKVLVTGVHGQLARALAEAPSAGMELIFAARPELDLAERGSAMRLIGALRPDAVVNAAAYTAVDQAEREPELAFAVNADGAEEVAAAAAGVGAPVIQLSTDYVFDGKASAPYREDSPTSPVNVYGASKLDGEERVRAANPAHLILRTSWVFSPFGSNFVKTMLRIASDRDEIRVVADQFGRPSSALDLAGALVAILGRWMDGETVGQGKMFHAACAGTCSWAEFANAIFEVSGRSGGPVAAVVPIATEDYPTPAQRPRSSVLDTSRLESDFGIRLPHWRAALDPVVARLIEPK